MQGNDAKIIKDKMEEWAFRLSMDSQLTEPSPHVTLFIEKYLEWYKKQSDKRNARPHKRIKDMQS